jgi:putative DNA primase/helicase
MIAETTRALDALQYIPPDLPRDEWVKAAMSAQAAGIQFDDFDEWSSTASNYSASGARSLWESIKPDRGIGAGTLFRMAAEHGWRMDKPQQRASSAPAVSTPAPAPKSQQKPAIAPESLWNRCEPAAAEHPYIIAKRGIREGLRIVGADDTATISGERIAGWLVVPAVSLAGELRTMQLIPPPEVAAKLKAAGKSTKLNLPGASFADGLFVVGDLAQRGYIVEGIGQAWACWQATGCAAVVCFGAGRMATVAELLRNRYPALRLVIVPDSGKEQQAEAIARKVRGEWVEMPDDKPANYDANDYAAEHGAEALAELLSRTKQPAMRYRVLTASDLMDTPPLRWLVRGVLPANGLASIYGASASGKTFLALDMCAAVADGVQWFGCRVSAAPVVYAALEGEHGFRQRVKAWQEHQGRDLPPALRFVMQPFDLRKGSNVADLADAVIASGGGGGLLVIDTLNRAAGGADENSSADMGQLIEAAKTLQSQLGGMLLLVHHSGKDASKGMRGHSSLHAALDAAIEVSRNDDRREWRIAKSKDDGDSATYPFRLVVVEIGMDEHGDPITSCAVMPDDAKGEIRRVLPPKSGNQRIAWDVLGEVLRKAGDVRPKDAPVSLPTGRPVVTLDDALAAIRDRLACDAKRKQERAQQALTGLQAKGLVRVEGSYVWVV